MLGLQVTLTDCVPAVLRTLAASVALNVASDLDYLQDTSDEQAQVIGLACHQIDEHPTLAAADMAVGHMQCSWMYCCWACRRMAALQSLQYRRG